MLIDPSSAYAQCTNPEGQAGRLLYNADQNVPQYCNGEDWIALGILNPAAGGGGCSNPDGVEGQIIYNGDVHMPQYCDGDDWRAMIGYLGAPPDLNACLRSLPIDLVDGGNFSNDVWTDGTYVFAALGGNFAAFSFNGTAITEEDAVPAGTGNYLSTWGDGTYVYAGKNNGALEAYTFDGSTLSLVGAYALTGNVHGIWGDGTYLYVANDTAGVRAFSFSGTWAAPIATYDSSGRARDVEGDGTYIFVADESGGLDALTFNGTSWSAVIANDATASYDVAISGSYIYSANSYSGFRALSFNGTSFALLDSFSGFTDEVGELAVVDGFIVTSNGDVFDFNGSNIAFRGVYTSSHNNGGVVSDGTYWYSATGNGGFQVNPACQ